MNSPRYSLLAMVVAGFLSLLSASGAKAADRTVARFEIFGFAGIHLLTNRTTVEQAPHRYNIAMDINTQGLARVFVDLSSHSEVLGELDSGAARPQWYRSNVQRNGVGRRYRLDYQADGTVIDTSPRPSSGPILRVTAAQLHGTVDQLTAYFLLQRQVEERGTCALVLRVFDGSGLYNLRFTNLGREMLSADGRQDFSGPSRSCEVVREDLVTDPDRDQGTYRRGTIWYARVIPGSVVMPVRMQYDTAFGIVKGYLAEVRGASLDVRLMKE